MELLVPFTVFLVIQQHPAALYNKLREKLLLVFLTRPLDTIEQIRTTFDGLEGKSLRYKELVN